MKKVAEILVAGLEQAGVNHVYGITGDSANYITDALRESSIKYVHVRHEESAAFAAGAESVTTGNLAVCIGSCGPGSLHLINGLFDANRNHASVIAIVTQIPSSEIGTEYIQEIDVAPLFKECSIYCATVQSADQLPRLLAIAMQMAVSKKGVATLIISGDFSAVKINFPCDKTNCFKNEIFVTTPLIYPNEGDMQLLATLIQNHKKIVIWCGNGAIKARKEVMQLAEMIKAPIAWTYRGKSAFDYNNPFAIGMNGILGNSACVDAIAKCDLLLLLGCDFAFKQWYPHKAAIVQIDIDGGKLGRRTPIQLGLVGDIALTIGKMLPLLSEKEENNFLKNAVHQYAKVMHKWEKLGEPSNNRNLGIFPETLMLSLNKKISKYALITADMGTPWAFMGRYINSLGGRTFYTSSLHGSMANALPDAIGLCEAHPQREIIAICGDGGLSMLMGELLTVVQEKLPIKIFVFNNSSLDFVSMEMKADGLLDTFTQLKNPNFADLAQVIGIKGIRVEKYEELDAAIDTALSYKGAALVDVVLNPYSMMMPPHFSFAVMQNFSLYLGKAMINGEKKEVIKTIETVFTREI